MPSPYLSIATKAMDQMRLLLEQFGMSPSSRTRVQALPVEAPTPSVWDELDKLG